MPFRIVQISPDLWKNNRKIQRKKSGERSSAECACSGVDVDEVGIEANEVSVVTVDEVNELDVDGG